MNGENPKKKAAREKFARWIASLDSPGAKPTDFPTDVTPDTLAADALNEIDPAGALPDECRQVSAMLPDYVALGGQAAERMPTVKEHLDRCDQCVRELGVILRVREDVAAWQRLAAAVGKPARRLVLAGGVWRWLSATGRGLIPVSREDFALGRRVGDWRLQPRVEGVLAFQQARETFPHLSLVAAVKEARSRLQLHVMPKFLPTVHRVVWRARIELECGAGVKSARVGLGSDEHATEGWRTLRQGNPVEFQFEDPGEKSYWFHLEWCSPSGEVVQKKLEIPLGSAAEEGT